MEGIESSDKRKRSGSGSDEEQAGKRSAAVNDPQTEEVTLIDIYREILALKTDFKRVEKKLEDKINSVEKRTDELEVKVHEQDKRLSELELNVEAGPHGGPCPSEEIEKLREELEKQQAYTRRYNLERYIQEG